MVNDSGLGGSRQVAFRLPGELLGRIDAERSGLSRNAWLIQAVEAFLGGSGVTPRVVAADVESRRVPVVPPAVASGPVSRAKAERLELARAVMRAASSSEAKAGVVPVGWQARTDAGGL